MLNIPVRRALGHNHLSTISLARGFLSHSELACRHTACRWLRGQELRRSKAYLGQAKAEPLVPAMRLKSTHHHQQQQRARILLSLNLAIQFRTQARFLATIVDNVGLECDSAQEGQPARHRLNSCAHSKLARTNSDTSPACCWPPPIDLSFDKLTRSKARVSSHEREWFPAAHERVSVFVTIRSDPDFIHFQLPNRHAKSPLYNSTPRPAIDIRTTSISLHLCL
jgi:hypothetical protein